MQPVELVPYDPKWSEHFLYIAAELARVPDFYGAPIEHIGSTAIVGLEAKNVIDVQVGVTSISRFDHTQPALTDLGYTYLPELTDHIPAGREQDAASWAKQFWTTTDRIPKVNLHIRQLDNPNWRFALLFREYLQADPDAATSYVAAKWQLATTVDAAVYSSTKDPIIDEIMVTAEQWASANNWTAQSNAD